MITIIIPAYNARKHIRRALDSIKCQSILNELEVIIVNDGDKCDYSSSVTEYRKYFEIREIRLKINHGPGYARNIGIKYARGEYLYFLDADDEFFSNDALEILYNNIDNSNFIVGKYQMEGKELHSDTYLQGKLYKKEFIDRYKIAFPNIRINEPVTFCLSCFFLSEDNYNTLENIICIYHRDIDSSITRTYDNFIKSIKLYIYAFELAYKKAKKHNRLSKTKQYLNLAFDYLASTYYEKKGKFSVESEEEYFNACRKLYLKLKKVFDLSIDQDTYTYVFIEKIKNYR